MPKKTDMRQLSELKSIREVQREKCTGDLSAAMHSHERAGDIENRSIKALGEAVMGWREYLRSPHFSPEHSQNLSASVLKKEHEKDQASKLVSLARQRVADSQNAWLAADLRYTLAANLQKNAAKKQARRKEEKSLAETGDIFAFRSKAE